MRQTLLSAGAVLLMLSSPALMHAQQTISFNTDPFIGSEALNTPGRQVVGGELFTTFSVADDRFVFEPSVFNIGNTINFANGFINAIAASGLNTIVLQDLDNDANPVTGFGAGNAANLLAERITSSGAGFFIYFNSGLNLPRLVYSTDLSDNTADLKILARMTNFQGDPGVMPTFTSANFVIAPEPSTLVLLAAGGSVLLLGMRAKRVGRS